MGETLEVNIEPANYFGGLGMQAIEILFNKFLIFKVIYLTLYGNGLKLVMIFTPSRPISQARLSASEILEISQEISRHYSPVATAKSSVLAARITLSPTEMLGISEEISRKHTIKTSAGTPQLVLLPVDPDHLHAYWNPGQDRTILASKDDPHEIVLRIYSQPDENTKAIATKPWFDIAIDNSRTQQKVLLRMHANASAYSAAIGKRYPDDRLTAFATSNLVHIPRISTTSYQPSDSAITPSATSQVLLSSREQSHSTNKNASGLGI